MGKYDGYDKSEKRALKKGYKEVFQYNKARKDRYFIKKGKKWIHNIEALKVRLGITKDKKLKKKGYDVKAYYKYNDK